ncbi:hypothetical protein MMC34_000228 [Xylographa carneopallida]|nr:hypothetical protein [Xylographa carneopallida]
MASNTNITLWQKIDIFLAIIQSLIKTLGAIVLAPFRGPDTPKTFKRHISLTLGRNVIGRLSPQQMQFIRGSTEKNYLAWTTAHHVSPKSISLPSPPIQAFWVGDPTASTTLLYFHGGGWGMPGSSGHFSFASALIARAASAGKSLAVLFLAYDLAPSKRYPHQLTQCVELLRHVLTMLHKSPSQIMLGGDSAGGNLVFGVLAHLLHPHAAIAPLKLEALLRAAFAVSPIASFDTDYPSDRQDPAPRSTIKAWLGNYLGASPTDRWNDPAATDVAWWRGVDGVVRETLITVAAHEMMGPGTQAFAKKLDAASEHFTLFTAENDFHAEPTIGIDLGFEESEASRALKAWVVERL